MSLQDRMNRLFQEATERNARSDQDDGLQIERADWLPPADIYNGQSEYVLAIDLPGINRDELEISLDNDRLTIRGERVIEHEGGQRAERPHGRFVRKFGVPATVDQKAIAAEYKDGVLRIRLPKRTEQKARKVEIKVS